MTARFSCPSIVLIVAVTAVAQWPAATSFALNGTEDMAFIPGGVFEMGDNLGDGGSDELPVHTVHVSGFFLDKCEVTQMLWSEVYLWAIANGYGFDNAGLGKAPDHPVHKLSWYDAVKWCNARSEKEGLTPCYFTDATQMTVYRAGRVDVANDGVDWTANGYRLPTDAEWEKAARGGATGRRFPWPWTEISHGLANYYSSASISYDTSSTRGYHPTYLVSGHPFTGPVGSFSPNDYRLYDMAGNVWEWCWDWHQADWYSQDGATHSNTRGPIEPTGFSSRVLRGGYYGGYGSSARCANRSYEDPASASFEDAILGFRCARGLESMVLIPGGSFQMGDSLHDGASDELPVHAVYVKPFYMDRYEVNSTLWDEVYAWAIANGYGFDNNWGSGKSPSHPVVYGNWYDAVKWCNARSEKEGLSPCYFTDATQMTVYRAGRVDVANDGVNWTANGYRLPTETEWEKAARGGATGRRFPWSDTDIISHDKANYWASGVELYDLSSGPHPDYDRGGWPYSSPVASFPPNDHGLCDMAGNVAEWCWDWYGDSYYHIASSGDPQGPVSGTDRVVRGGSWQNDTANARCANRAAYLPGDELLRVGFRCVRFGCDYSIAPTSASFGAMGGERGISVSAGVGCGWTATENVNWVTITSGANGTGNVTIQYRVAMNSTPNLRRGTITVAGQPFTVSQAGCEAWECLYGVMFKDQGDLAMFRRYRDSVLREDPLGDAATTYLYEQSEAALDLLSTDGALAERASAVASENFEAIGDSLIGETGTVTDTVSVIVFLWEVEQRAPDSLAQLARTTRFIITWKLLTGREFLGIRFEQWPWIKSSE